MCRLDLTTRHVIVAVFIAIYGAQQASGLRCHLCNAGEPTSFCNATSNTVLCRGNEDSCITQITNSGSGLTSWKGCIEASMCASETAADPMVCDSGVVMTRCSYCCQDDQCNYDRFSYSVTLPQPTTPEPMDTTTARMNTMTSLSTLAPPTCSSGNLTACVINFRRYLNETVYNPRGNLPSFCREVPFIFLCVVDSLQTCVQGDTDILTQTTQQVAQALYNDCPRDCSPSGGIECTQTFMTRVTETLVYGSTHCTTVTREYQQLQHCVAYCIGSCDVTRRIQYEVITSSCYKQVQVICETSPPEVPPVLPPHPDSPCHVSEALEILSALGAEIVERLSRNDNLEDICTHRLEETLALVAVKTAECDEVIQERIDDVIEVIHNVLGTGCEPSTPAPVCNMTAARACVYDLWVLIDEAEDFEEVCRAIPETRECAELNTAACTEEERQSVQDNLEIFINRVGDRCDTTVESETPCNETITLVEGGAEHELKFNVAQPPSSLCGGIDDCKIYVDFIVSDGEQPRCDDNRVIEQIVFRQSADGSSCSIEITNDNWQETHSVIMAAKLDLKIDGDQTRTVTMVLKKVVNGVVVEVRSICEYPVVVIDQDTNNDCSSVNDPHITTFDEHYYHNFRDGEYILYKHRSLPFQVNVLYQKCVYGASCNCGVAVKSGDSVFVAEKCRRRSDICPYDDSYCSSRQLRTHIYTHGSAAPNMRIFNKNGGHTFYVLLPHGTSVQIRSGRIHSKFINLWVVPSPLDWEDTEGLCGFYDNDKSNDLMLRNGETYTGSGRRKGQHPNKFNKHWQVYANESLFVGSPRHPYSPPHYCECPPDGGRDDCRDDELVEDCDMDIGTEMSAHLFPTVDLDEQVIQTDDGGRYRRDVTSQSASSFLADLDLDLDYEPPDEIVEEGTWSTEDAAQYCQDFIKNDRDWARKCLQVPGVDPTLQVQNCVDDILITGDTQWADAALEAFKAQCLNALQVDNDFGQTFEGRLLEQQIKNQLCPLDCSGHGTCEMATCICDAGYTGADCYFETDQAPEDLSLSEEGLCNIRASNCSIIVVFGNNFINSDSLTCHLQPIQVSDSGMSLTGPPSTVSAHMFTLNQILCVAPEEGSYLVDVSNDGTTPSGEQKMHLAFDPNCFYCYTDAHSEGPVCLRRSDGCVVDGQCFRSGETQPDDDCYSCAPSKSDSSLTRQFNAECYMMEIIIAVVVVVLVLIIICIIICCCCCCRKKKRARDDKEFTESSAMFRTTRSMEMTKATPLVSSA